jgi:hypothetical protein
MAGLVNALTPPPATNTCDDFTTSFSLGPVWPWPPIGGGGVPPTAAQIAAAATQAAAATAATAAAAGVVTTTATPAGSTAANPPASGPGWQHGRMRRGPMFGRSGGRAGGSGYFQKGGIQNQAQAMAPRFDASCGPMVIPVPGVKTPAQAAASAPPAPVACSATPATMPQNLYVAGGAGFQLSNTSRPGQPFQVGDCFMLIVMGPPNLPVTGSWPVSSSFGARGNTDANGYYIASGQVQSPGQFGVDFSVGGGQAAPQVNSYPVTASTGLSGLGCGGSDLSQVLVIALGVTAGLFFAGWIAKEMVTG